MADTSGNLSEALIASMAAGLLDEFHVTSLDDDSAVGRFMAREFGVTRNEVNEMYPWHQLKSRAVLSSLADAPAFGWTYQYQLPADCARVIPPNTDGTFHDAPIPHEVESGVLLCNVGPTLNVLYIRKETRLDRWSALMGRVLATRLAMYAASRVTGKLSYFEKVRTAYNDIVFEAKHVDSLTRGTQETYYASSGDSLLAHDSLNVRTLGYQ